VIRAAKGDGRLRPRSQNTTKRANSRQVQRDRGARDWGARDGELDDTDDPDMFTSRLAGGFIGQVEEEDAVAARKTGQRRGTTGADDPDDRTNSANRSATRRFRRWPTRSEDIKDDDSKSARGRAVSGWDVTRKRYRPA